MPPASQQRPRAFRPVVTPQRCAGQQRAGAERKQEPEHAAGPDAHHLQVPKVVVVILCLITLSKWSQQYVDIHQNLNKIKPQGRGAAALREASQSFGLGFDRDWDPLTVLQVLTDYLFVPTPHEDIGREHLLAMLDVQLPLTSTQADTQMQHPHASAHVAHFTCLRR